MNSQSLKKKDCSVVWSYGMCTVVRFFTDGGQDLLTQTTQMVQQAVRERSGVQQVEHLMLKISITLQLISCASKHRNKNMRK